MKYFKLAPSKPGGGYKSYCSLKVIHTNADKTSALVKAAYAGITSTSCTNPMRKIKVQVNILKDTVYRQVSH